MAFEVVIDNAMMQVHCHDEAPPVTTHVIELPATVITDAPSNGGTWFNDSLSVEGDAGSTPSHSAIFMPNSVYFSPYPTMVDQFTVIGKYGSGAKKLNFDLPSGATLVSLQYVIRAYRESSFANSPGDIVVARAAVTFGSAPPTASFPVAAGKSSVRNESAYFPDLVVTTSWADAIEVVANDPNPSAALSDDEPFDHFAAVQGDSGHSAVVKWDYLAVRITYND